MRDELIQRWMNGLPDKGSSVRAFPARLLRARRIITRAADGPFGYLDEADLDMLVQEVASLGAEILLDRAITLPERREFLNSLVQLYEGVSLEWRATGWGFELFWRTILREIRKEANTQEVAELEARIQAVLVDYLARATDSEPQLTWGWAAFEALHELGGPESQAAFSSFMERADGPDLLRKQISWFLGQSTS
jgi:hypothetical protein